jgi:catechol 2,3-dioxygenase-like lactoylglutathione lyase family enzyme
MRKRDLAASVLLFLSPVTGYGEDASAPRVRAVGAFVAISVPALDASARWYSDKLGLKVVKQEPKRDGVAFAILEGGGFLVELMQLDAAQPRSKVAPAVKEPELIHGISKAGILVEDFEQTLATLRAHKVEIAYGPFPVRPGERANVIVRDNAGNLLQFFGPIGR